MLKSHGRKSSRSRCRSHSPTRHSHLIHRVRVMPERGIGLWYALIARAGFDGYLRTKRSTMEEKCTLKVDSQNIHIYLSNIFSNLNCNRNILIMTVTKFVLKEAENAKFLLSIFVHLVAIYNIKSSDHPGNCTYALVLLIDGTLRSFENYLIIFMLHQFNRSLRLFDVT